MDSNRRKTDYSANTKYHKKNYENMLVTVPIGERKKVKEYCEKECTTFNTLVNEFLEKTVPGFHGVNFRNSPAYRKNKNDI